MPVLSLDLGNSALKAGLVEPGGGVSRPLRLAHDTADAPQRLTAWLATLPPIEGAALASVAPSRSDSVIDAVQRTTGVAVQTVHAGSRWPFTIGYATPATIGTDRLAAVCGALADAHSDPLVVVDAGTATTVEAVTARRTYLGGAIVPSPDLLATALGRGTSQLPVVDVGVHMPVAIGRSTHDALRSGTLGFFVHGLAGLVEATCAELNPGDPGRVRVIATGGWAPFLATVIPRLADVRPHLVLAGIARVAEAERAPVGP